MKKVQFANDLPTYHPGDSIILRTHRTREKDKHCPSSLHEVELEQWSLFGITIPPQIGMQRRLLCYLSLDELNSFLQECNTLVNDELPRRIYYWLIFFLPLIIYFICLPAILEARSKLLIFVLPVVMIGLGCLFVLLLNYVVMKSIHTKLSYFIEAKNMNTFKSRGCCWKIYEDGAYLSICLLCSDNQKAEDLIADIEIGFSTISLTSPRPNSQQLYVPVDEDYLD